MAKTPLLTGIAKPMISSPKTPAAAQPIKVAPQQRVTSAPKSPTRAVAARPAPALRRKITVQPMPMGGRKRNY